MGTVIVLLFTTIVLGIMGYCISGILGAIIGAAIIPILIWIICKLSDDDNTKKDQKTTYEASNTKPASNPKPKCPTCGSTHVEKISTLNRAVSIGIAGLASDKIGKQFQCKNFGYKW